MNKPNLICTIFYRLNDQEQLEHSIEADFSPIDFGRIRQDVVELFYITREHLDERLNNPNRIIDRFRIKTTEGEVLADEHYPFN